MAQQAVAALDDHLAPLRAAYEMDNQRGKEIANVRRRIDELCAKADEAERRYDLETALDLRYYAIPDLEKRRLSLTDSTGKVKLTWENNTSEP
jgi:ATP-dependent Clp protease ATP-binding subunit ClpB